MSWTASKVPTSCEGRNERVTNGHSSIVPDAAASPNSSILNGFFVRKSRNCSTLVSPGCASAAESTPVDGRAPRSMLGSGRFYQRRKLGGVPDRRFAHQLHHRRKLPGVGARGALKLALRGSAVACQGEQNRMPVDNAGYRREAHHAPVDLQLVAHSLAV